LLFVEAPLITNKFISTFLVIGIKSKKPIASVKKPGTIKSRAANAIDAPRN